MADIIHLHQNRAPEPEPLWREALGRNLRASREELGGRLVDVADRAGISPQYLSEIERGRKEPSSEMIAAVAGALGVDLADLLDDIAGDLRRRRPTDRRTRPDLGAQPDVGTQPSLGAQPDRNAKAVLTRLGRATRRPTDPVLLAA
jgi:transcriptional regulator with XRE-family HTH domain